jgi:myosin heavy subunit
VLIQVSLLQRVWAVLQGKEGAQGGKDKVSQASQFRKQLDDLMKTLNATEPHYIRWYAIFLINSVLFLMSLRCSVKPNNEKKGNIFTAPLCLQQLRYAGVFEAVKIRQQGFPFRWTHDQFYKRYRCIGGQPFRTQNIPKSGMDWKEGCRKLISDILIPVPSLEGEMLIRINHTTF